MSLHDNADIPVTTLSGAEEFLNRIPYFTKKHPPAHTKALLRALGDPQESFRVIHVAGSNGKGSVCSFLFHILKEAGCKAGLFVSPHLTDLRERFVTTDGMVSEADFLEAFEAVRGQAEHMEAAGEEYPTYFEFLFAVGMLLFQKAGIEIAVVETGMGGRLDCTNIIEKPLACVITSVSLEHQQYLGDTIQQIAAEKAGIIKQGVQLVYDGNDPKAAAVIREQAGRMRAPACMVTKEDVFVRRQTENGIEFCLRSIYDRDTMQCGERVWYIPFCARYQAMNAALAVTACRICFPDMEPDVIADGLAHTCWPGRMQQLLSGIWLDGAHNPDGIRGFAETVRDLCAGDPAQPSLLFSMVGGKDYAQAVRLLCEDITWKTVILTRIPSERGMDPGILQREFLKNGHTDVHMIDSCAEALAHLAAQRGPQEKAFCAGSLYFAGALLKEVEKQHAEF